MAALDFVSLSSAIYELLKEKITEQYLKSENDISHINRALHEEVASFAPKMRKIDKLINTGAQLDYQAEDGYTALMLAVDAQNNRIAECLLRNNANPLLKNKNDEMASTLALKNSRIYSILKGYELLRLVSQCDLRGIGALLRADPSVIGFQDSSGFTALIVAVKGSHVAIVQLLLSFGADPLITCYDGQGVFEFVTDDEINQLLLSNISHNEQFNNNNISFVDKIDDNYLDEEQESPYTASIINPSQFFAASRDSSHNQISSEAKSANEDHFILVNDTEK